jgi:hypothetical protein
MLLRQRSTTTVMFIEKLFSLVLSEEMRRDIRQPKKINFKKGFKIRFSFFFLSFSTHLLVSSIILMDDLCYFRFCIFSVRVNEPCRTLLADKWWNFKHELISVNIYYSIKKFKQFQMCQMTDAFYKHVLISLRILRISVYLLIEFLNSHISSYMMKSAEMLFLSQNYKNSWESFLTFNSS